MEYIKVIKNELGEIVRYCNQFTEEENENFYFQHPEYYYSTVSVDIN